ncbi:hypothetical protein GCM10009116_15760 [Brevundimonas basaltis]|uniref:Uncharacterized protein n=1 Tax=Brevundimonas basaltis TaxID=472166 RepID=A0A7W8HWC1_9CAUL|nr:DUF6766 family protein [Brevundimonas basaltis]MBB5291112.1 hypothetical protein [Brevundimonas basaltis]
MLALFFASLVRQALAGQASENAELADQGQPALSRAAYLTSRAFLSSLFENWESEFLQMWAFVMLTAYLFQRGSPEKYPDAPAPQDRDPALDAGKAKAPLPVRLGGMARVVYSHSLGLALFLLFIVSFVLHCVNSALAADQAQLHNEDVGGSLIAHVAEADFWFESFQNWQSKFLSTAVLIVLAIFMRERGSPESKPVGGPTSCHGCRLAALSPSSLVGDFLTEEGSDLRVSPKTSTSALGREWPFVLFLKAVIHSMT